MTRVPDISGSSPGIEFPALGFVRCPGGAGTTRPSRGRSPAPIRFRSSGRSLSAPTRTRSASPAPPRCRSRRRPGVNVIKGVKILMQNYIVGPRRQPFQARSGRHHQGRKLSPFRQGEVSVQLTS